MKKEILEKMLDSKKNLIVSGDISTGKTKNVLFPFVEEIINNNQSILILDSKEEYINKYYNKLKENNYNVLILNLKDLNKSEGWNPLEYPYNLYKEGKVDEAIDYIEQQAKIMFYEGGQVDPFWSTTASDFYTGLVLGLFEDGKEDEINLNSISLMFDGINNKFGISDYITNYFKMKSPSSQAYVYASTTFLAPSETKGSIVSVARQKLRTYVSRELLSSMLNKTTFDYNDIMNKKTAIFLISKEENSYINNVATMFIEQLFTILVKLNNKNKFNFILDNIDSLENMNELSNMLSTGIANNMKFAVATRSFDDLINQYGNYITKLSNNIVVDKEIKLTINGEDIIENKEDILEDNYNSNIEYPTLTRNKIEMFNVEEFVRVHKKDMFQDSFSANPFPSLNPDLNQNRAVDDLIKCIDEKIEQLNQEEKMYNVEKENIEVKSDFAQFKTE